MDEMMKRERDAMFAKLGWSEEKTLHQNDWRGTEVDQMDYKKEL